MDVTERFSHAVSRRGRGTIPVGRIGGNVLVAASIPDGDAWASFETESSIPDWLHESLGLASLSGHGVIVVELEYTDWGVGRRHLFGS